jgi:hypothetical protein
MHKTGFPPIGGRGQIPYSPYPSWLRDVFEVSADQKTVSLGLTTRVRKFGDVSAVTYPSS